MLANGLQEVAKNSKVTINQRWWRWQWQAVVVIRGCKKVTITGGGSDGGNERWW